MQNENRKSVSYNSYNSCVIKKKCTTSLFLTLKDKKMTSLFDFFYSLCSPYFLVLILCIILPGHFFFYYKFTFTKKNLPQSRRVKEGDGGFIEKIRKLHAEQGLVVSSNLPIDNAISVADAKIVKESLQIGDRPKELFKFLEPLVGEDNIQIYNTERAHRFRKLTGPAFGHQGESKMRET